MLQNRTSYEFPYCFIIQAAFGSRWPGKAAEGKRPRERNGVFVILPRMKWTEAERESTDITKQDSDHYNSSRCYTVGWNQDNRLVLCLLGVSDKAVMSVSPCKLLLRLYVPLTPPSPLQAILVYLIITFGVIESWKRQAPV